MACLSLISKKTYLSFLPTRGALLLSVGAYHQRRPQLVFSEELVSEEYLVLHWSWHLSGRLSPIHSCVSEESTAFQGGQIRVRRTIYQVEEEIAIMEVHHSEKQSKSAASKVGKFGGRLLKSLFDSSPAEVLFHDRPLPKAKDKHKEREHKEATHRSSSNKSSSSTGYGNEGKPYTIANVSKGSPPHPTLQNSEDPIELSGHGFEEPNSSPLYPVARKNHHRQDTYDNFITPGIRAYPKPRESKENSKYSPEKDSPGRSSRTTSTETSSYSNNFESDADFSTDSTGDRISRREKERNQKALINRLHAEAMKMKLEKAEEEMQKLRMELDAYKSDSNSNAHSIDGGDRRNLSRINSLEGSSHSQNGGRRPQESHGTSFGSKGRLDSTPVKSTFFAADQDPEQQADDDSDREIPPANWIEGQPDLDPILGDTPVQVDNAWRSAQMYTFLQDAAAVNTVNAAVSSLKQEKTEKKVALEIQKSRAQSRSQSRVQSPTHAYHEELAQQQQALSHQQQPDSGYFHPSSTPLTRNNHSPAANIHQLQQHQQHQVHNIERSRTVETITSSSSSTSSQERVMKRTQSVESNSSNKSGHSPKTGGHSYTSPRPRSNTTIAERISRTHNVMHSNVQQPISTFSPDNEIHRPQQQLLPVDPTSSFQAEPAAVGYRQSTFQSNFQSSSHQVESDARQQVHLVSQTVDEKYQRHSSYYRQTPSPPQPEAFSQPQRQLEFPIQRQPAESFTQPELFGRHQQEQKQVEPEIHRKKQLQQQMDYREQQPSILPQQQSATASFPKQINHERARSMTFPFLPQLSLEVKPVHEPEETSVSSPLQLSPTSSGLITPTSMTPPTVFQSDEDRVAWQHQQTLERMYNARRNREALLMKQRGATAAR
ncbi:hypothetical protein R1flu_000179 [Riccia fluitans]|uniref:Uncharacterized protein n=1 Tax=Riccia fluitans TaxID=41844 RepID=A0ABD1Y0L9_9MARC